MQPVLPACRAKICLQNYQLQSLTTPQQGFDRNDFGPWFKPNVQSKLDHRALCLQIHTDEV